MKLLITLLIFILLNLGVKKKIDLRTLLFGLTFLCLLGVHFTGGTILDTESTGSVILDCLTFMGKYTASNVGGIVFTMMVVIAYVEVLNHLQATDALAYFLFNRLQFIKNPYMMSIAVVVIGFLMQSCISLAPALVALMCPLFFPLLLSYGCSPQTAAVTMLVPTVIAWGPADANTMTSLQLMGLDTNLTWFFTQYEIPIVLLMLVTISLVFVLSARVFDKRATSDAAMDVALKAKPPVPTYYAFMPLLPMASMLLFSRMSLELVPACLLSLLVSMAIVVCTEKRLSFIVDMFKIFFNGFGENLKNLGFMVLLSMTFASALNKLGGLQQIAEFLMQFSLHPVVITMVNCLLAAGICSLMGSLFGALSIVLPLAASMSAGTAINQPVLCYLVLLSCQSGCLTCPVNPVVLIVSDRCNMEVPELIKRIALPVWTCIILVPLITTLFLS